VTFRIGASRQGLHWIGYSIPRMTELCLALLRLLRDGEFHSGEALARALGVSRGTVWNAVRALEASDLELHKVHGRGYRLAQPLSLLDAREVERCAGPGVARLAIEIVDAVGSTNSVMMARAAAGASSGSVIAAESQSGGRGRMGRAWQAGLGRSLTFSLLWRFGKGAAELAGLSLAAGVGVLRALNALGAREVGLKWPNDVVWRDRKIAGILIEMHGDALGPSAVVVGIGLNIRLSQPMRDRIDQPACDLETVCGQRLDRNAVLGLLLAHLGAVLEQFESDGFASLRREWEGYHAHQGRPIVVKLPNGRSESGTARGIAEDGALIFESGGTTRALHSGEISVRAAAAPPAASRQRARSAP
jgi:BirA family biotin operon repressor/biotin-[acetyl-CoA-carboxylase] ligase